MAQKTGWATLIDGRIESGVQDFTKRRGESNGMLFLRFNAWLNNMAEIPNQSSLAIQIEGVQHYKFDLVVYERAHHRGGAATEIGVGLMTRAQEYAAHIGAEYMAVHTASLKKFATGNGRASKEDMVFWASKKMERFIEDDNEADALALLFFAIQEIGVKA